MRGLLVFAVNGSNAQVRIVMPAFRALSANHSSVATPGEGTALAMANNGKMHQAISHSITYKL